jgi:uncharacterized protein with von Willebrand factor type A (vWA) domain
VTDDLEPRAPATAPPALLDAVLAFAGDLRDSGVDTAIADTLDAVEALQHVDVGSRSLLRAALQATLVKRAQDLDVFAVLFDAHFPLTAADLPPGDARAGDATSSRDSPAPPARTDHRGERDALLAELTDALRGGDDEALVRLAGRAVTAYSGIDVHDAGERYFLYRVMRALDLSNLLIALMARVRAERPDASGFERRQLRDDLRERIEQFRRLLAAAIRSRLVERGARPPGGREDPRRIEDIDVAAASTTELRLMRAAVRPLARRLASRVGQRRRRHRHGRIDIRRTVRRSLETGGTPLNPAFRQARRTKPQLVVLCDISGSVAEFAHFTLMLLHALQAELAGLRAFVFVDGVAEMTTLLAQADAFLDPRLLVTLPGVVDHDGHSDYGRALGTFVERHRDAVGPGTTVLITGDARTNYRASGVESLRLVRGRCRRLYWFNPEPPDEWDADDSALSEFGDLCDGVFEVRTLNQLGDAVAAII